MISHALVGLALLIVSNHITHDATVQPPAGYDIYDANEGPGDLPVADCLFAHGYRGIPGDRHEYIYAPGSVIEQCVADLSAPIDSNGARPIKGDRYV